MCPDLGAETRRALRVASVGRSVLCASVLVLVLPVVLAFTRRLVSSAAGARGGEPNGDRFVTWSRTDGLLALAQAHMTSNEDKVMFNCVETGKVYRSWRRVLFAVGAGKADESGSSWSDHLLDIDMGGQRG